MMKRYLFYLWNLWPPFLFSGIKIDYVSKDFMTVRMRLKKRFWNRNLVGTQYGGSIYSMTDPIYMAMLLDHLQYQYIVWDKSAHIRFRRPGRTDLLAEFKLTAQDILDIKTRLKTEEKFDWERQIHVVDTAGQVVAEVTKVIHIRNKEKL
jgi:acyl-coenzyme A thioesterase PaaI-like protein